MKCTSKLEVVKRTVIDETEMITLKMTAKEASILLEVCNRVGGKPGGPRGVMDEIASSLNKANIKSYVGAVNGGIDFN
jgi:hypothetical protein